MTNYNDTAFQSSLLTKTETDWLLGKTQLSKSYEYNQLSKSYEYKIKSIIKRKLKTFNEFELPLILNSGLFPEAANLAIFKNHNGATIKTSSDYPDLDVKEDEETWAGFGQGNLASESSLGKAKVPGPNPGQGSSLP
jgi:hypothetical protein